MMTQEEFEKEFVGKIICGDCLEIMKDFPDGCVDLVLTDPPYGIDGGRGGNSKRGKAKYYSPSRNHHGDKNTYSNFPDTREYIKTTVISREWEALVRRLEKVIR